MSEPLFSVIIATYNRPHLLSQAIASVREQSISDFECLVVDDAGSEPATVPNDPRFRVVRREMNGGFPAALNTGLDHARGKYIAFLDDDDLYTPERLEMALEGLSRAPLTFCWEAYLGKAIGGGRTLEGEVGDVILDHLTPSLGTVSIRRELAGRFDEQFTGAEDLEWWLRTTQTIPVSTVTKIGYLVRLHDGPRNKNGVVERIRCNLQLLERYSGWFTSRPRAAAFRWKRIGLMSRKVGDHALARSAFWRSLWLHPEPATAWHLIRSVRRSTTALFRQRVIQELSIDKGDVT